MNGEDTLIRLKRVEADAVVVSEYLFQEPVAKCVVTVGGTNLAPCQLLLCPSLIAGDSDDVDVEVLPQVEDELTKDVSGKNHCPAPIGGVVNHFVMTPVGVD